MTALEILAVIVLIVANIFVTYIIATFVVAIVTEQRKKEMYEKMHDEIVKEVAQSRRIIEAELPQLIARATKK